MKGVCMFFLTSVWWFRRLEDAGILRGRTKVPDRKKKVEVADGCCR